MPTDQPSNGPRLPMGFMIVGSEMVSFTLLGLLLDYAFGTLPVLTVCITLLGVGVAFFHLIKMAQTLTRKKAKPPE